MKNWRKRQSRSAPTPAGVSVFDSQMPSVLEFGGAMLLELMGGTSVDVMLTWNEVLTACAVNETDVALGP